VEKAEETPKYEVAVLREYCYEVLGVTTSTFDGAFFDAEDRTYSLEEAKEILNTWLNKEVK
jgi:hypothetical protein